MNHIIKPLKWCGNEVTAAGRNYRIQKDHGGKVEKGQFYVVLYNLAKEKTTYKLHFHTADAAKHWAEYEHFRPKMIEEYINEGAIK